MNVSRPPPVKFSELRVCKLEPEGICPAVGCQAEAQLIVLRTYLGTSYSDDEGLKARAQEVIEFHKARGCPKELKF